MSSRARPLTENELNIIVTGLAAMADRLSKVASLLGEAYGHRWANRAQLVRTGLIALRHDVGDVAAGDRLESEADPTRVLLGDHVAGLDTISRWVSDQCVLDPGAVARPETLVNACQSWAETHEINVPTAAKIRDVLVNIFGVQWRMDKVLGAGVHGIKLKEELVETSQAA